MEQKLSPYNEVYVNVTSLLADQIYSDLRKLEYEFVSELTAANLFGKFNLGECQSNCDRALKIVADVVDILQVSETISLLGPAPPGRITVKMIFIDGGSGREIGNYMVYGDSGGTFSPGTNAAIKKAAKSMVEIIKKNF